MYVGDCSGGIARDVSKFQFVVVAIKEVEPCAALASLPTPLPCPSLLSCSLSPAYITIDIPSFNNVFRPNVCYIRREWP